MIDHWVSSLISQLLSQLLLSVRHTVGDRSILLCNDDFNCDANLLKRPLNRL